MDQCLVCASRQWTPKFLTAEWQMVSCLNCGLTWRQFHASDPALPEVNRPLISNLEGEASYGLGSQFFRSHTPECGVAELEEINQFRSPPGAFLNLGIEDLDILESARLFGWMPQAMSLPEEQPVHREVTVLAASVTSNLGLLASAAEGYDVIRGDGLLEQVSDPRHYLDWCKERLNHQGLVVFSFIDSQEWDFPLFGEGSYLWGLTLPRWLFTPRALESLLDQQGFRVLKISPYTVATPLHPVSSFFAPPPPWGGDLPAPLNLKQHTYPTQKMKRFRLIARYEETPLPLPYSNWNYQSLPRDNSQFQDYSAKLAEVCPS